MAILHLIEKKCVFIIRALGQMFDKLNSAEQVEGAESVVKVRLKKNIYNILYLHNCPVFRKNSLDGIVGDDDHSGRCYKLMNDP